MATANWRTINIDLLDPDSPANFDSSSLLPSVPSVSAQEVQALSGQIKQLLRGGDSEGALRGALENAPYGGDAGAKVSPMSLLSLPAPQSLPATTHRGKRRRKSIGLALLRAAIGKKTQY